MCSSQQHTASEAPLMPLRILVADDDPVIRKLFSERLEAAGYQVVLAADGREAAETIRTTRFDVVLTDLVMPGNIGGIELLEIVRERDTRTEVIVFTAHSSVPTAVAAMKKGAVDYLEKPVNFEELFLRLDRLAQVRHLARDASDLREAMTVTEAAANRTIADLEIRVAGLQKQREQALQILADTGLPPERRISKAMTLLAREE